MADETLQEKYIRELLDPRQAKSPRENAAAEEIRELRRKLGLDPETGLEASKSPFKHGKDK